MPNVEVLDKEVLKNLSLEEMMALSLEEIPELEEFELIPTGVYIFDVEPAELDTSDDDTKKHFIGLTLKVASVVELVDPAQAEAVKPGESKLAQRFYASFGIQRFAKMFAGVTEQLRANKAEGEGVSVVELLESVGGRQIQATVTHRTQKLSKEQKAAGEVAKVYGEVDPHTTVLIG